MLDLPTPRTLEECTEHARQYAEHLLSLPMIKAMAWLRQNIRPDNHPRWFILYLDDQIARIKFRIEGLSSWKHRNPEHAARMVYEMIRQVYYLMQLSIGRTWSAPVSSDAVGEWLKELTSDWNGEDYLI